MTAITFDSVSKTFSDGTRAVNELTLDIDEGEFMVFVGPSGCGKTTALRMVAGLETITSGSVLIGGRVINHVRPQDRDIAMVFQNYALYPHMTVEDNLAFGLRRRQVKKEEIKRRVAAAAQNLGLEEYLGRRPRALSGGQRQRVAMGRAIVREPQAFLMDEPLSNLDAKLRVQMRAEIHNLQRRLAVTTIYVTHDQTEAMTMGDRIAIMNGGILQQVGSPETVYHHPANAFVAGFIGSPAMNMMPARLCEGTDGLRVEFGSYSLSLPPDTLMECEGLERYLNGVVLLGIRPEDMEDVDCARDPQPGTILTAHCTLREALGAELLVHFPVDDHVDGGSTRGSLDGAPQASAGFIARVSPSSGATEGGVVRLAINTRQLHFFDPETGEAIARRAARPRTPVAAREASGQ